MNPCTTRLGLLPGWEAGCLHVGPGRWCALRAWGAACIPGSPLLHFSHWLGPSCSLYNKPPAVGKGYSSRLPNLRKRAVLTPSALSDSSQPFPLKPIRLLCPWASQARILEWVDISFSRGSSRLRDRTCISCVSKIAGRFFTTEPMQKDDRNPQIRAGLVSKKHWWQAGTLAGMGGGTVLWDWTLNFWHRHQLQVHGIRTELNRRTSSEYPMTQSIGVKTHIHTYTFVHKFGSGMLWVKTVQRWCQKWQKWGFTRPTLAQRNSWFEKRKDKRAGNEESLIPEQLPTHMLWIHG